MCVHVNYFPTLKIYEKRFHQTRLVTLSPVSLFSDINSLRNDWCYCMYYFVLAYTILYDLLV